MNEEKLINEVQRRKFLYDMSASGYSNQALRDNAWIEIATEVGFTVKECKKCWANLRDSYRKAMLKRKGKSGQAALKIRAWKYEDQMKFLSSHIIERDTHSNITSELTNSVELEENITVEDNENDVAVDDPSTPDNDTNLSPQPSTSSSESSTSARSKRENVMKNKITKKSPNDEVATALLQYLKNKADNTEKPLEEKTNSQLVNFFMTIAQTVDNFPKCLQVEVKSKIFTLVSDYEMRLARGSLHPDSMQIRDTEPTLFEMPTYNSDNEQLPIRNASPDPTIPTFFSL